MTDNRSHLEEKYTWDLSTIFATDKDWEAEVSDLATEVEASKGFAGHLLDSSANLLKVTKTYLELARRVEKVYVYAHMKMTKTLLLPSIKNTKLRLQACMQSLAKSFHSMIQK